MATMNTVIEYVDRMKPNVYSDDDKYRWINTVEGLVSHEVHNEPDYSLPDDADAPLLIPAPYDEIYILYVFAMIDFHNSEYNAYNNTVLLFTERLNQYKTWYVQHDTSGKGGNFRNVMG